MKILISLTGRIIRKIFGKNSVKKIYLSKYLLTIFLKTILLRLNNSKFLLWPIRHLGMLYLLLELKKIFKNKNFTFFLFDGALLGCIRQGAVAGRGKDLDIGVIVGNTKEKALLIKILKNRFMIKEITKDNFHLIHKKLNNFVDLSIFKFQNKQKNLCFYSGIKKKKMLLKTSYILPLKNKTLYFENCKIPNKAENLLKIFYGDDYLIPDKKSQLFLKK